MQILLILSLIIAIFAVIFAVSNTASTEVSFFSFTLFNGSLALVLIIAMLVGVLISMLASMPTMIKNSLAIRKLNKKLVEMEKSLNEKTVKLEEAEKQLIVKENELNLARQSRPEEKVVEIVSEAEELKASEPPQST